MADVSAEVLAAVRRKLNVTWEDEDTDARILDVVSSVSPSLASRLGLGEWHEFRPDSPGWGLFLNACLYEFSDALDDFWRNYRSEIAECRLMVVAATGVMSGD